jgi:ribose-phosphate pyrophosphokinase
MANGSIFFGGSANPELARKVAAELGIPMGRSRVERFPDGEVSVQLEESVRRKEVFVLQPTSPSVDQNLVELLVFADAARRSAADRVTAIIPYFGYARSDRRHGRREPIAARMVGDVLQAVGIRQVVTLDLHTDQVEGFFNIPVEHLSAVGVLAEEFRGRLPADAVVVAPDEGRVPMATRYAESLGLPLVALQKRRESGSKARITGMAGEVSGRSCLLVDDMISTGGTLVAAMDALLAAGARPDIRIAVTHGLLLADARELLDREELLELVVTDTVPQHHTDWEKLRVRTVATVIAAALQELMVGSPSSHPLPPPPHPALR